jgi:hypothetical protein
LNAIFNAFWRILNAVFMRVWSQKSCTYYKKIPYYSSIRAKVAGGYEILAGRTVQLFLLEPIIALSRKKVVRLSEFCLLFETLHRDLIITCDSK